MTPGIITDPVALCLHPPSAVYWNEFNGVVQCHACGTVAPIVDWLWRYEPDKVEWESTERYLERPYLCRVQRASALGFLCGYVSVPFGHPWNGQDADQIEADVHGGLTYEAPEGDYWCVGFDCGHANDLCPDLIDGPLAAKIHEGVEGKWKPRRARTDVYWDVEMVVREVNKLLRQAVHAAAT
jgi:hypothetical protein